MVIFEVHLMAFRNGDIRLVAVPEAELAKATTIMGKLEAIYYRGQNDFALLPQRLPSMSMGDVVDYQGILYRVAAFGFKQMSQGEFEAYKTVPQRERAFGLD